MTRRPVLVPRPPEAPRPSGLAHRSPGQGSGWGDALAQAGFHPVFVPLIDFERTGRPEELRALPARLAQAEARPWLIVTSATTVRALQDAGLLEALREARAGFVLAAVGPASARALEEAGLTPDRMPSAEQGMNAEGLVELCSAEPPAAAFLPQTDLAAPTLAEGLRGLGWDVVVLEAYRTVDAPADPDRRLPAPDSQPDQAQGEAWDQCSAADAPAREWFAAVGMSPSSARRIHGLFRAAGVPVPPLVAIGPSTEREAVRLGLPLAAVAAEPTPAVVAAALTDLHSTTISSLHPTRGER